MSAEKSFFESSSRNERAGVYRSPEVAVRHLPAAHLLLLRHLLVLAEQVRPLDGLGPLEAQREGSEGSKTGKSYDPSLNRTGLKCMHVLTP